MIARVAAVIVLAATLLLPWALVEHPVAGAYRVYPLPLPVETLPGAPYILLAAYAAVVATPRGSRSLALGLAALLYGAAYWGWLLNLPRLLPEPVAAAPLGHYWRVHIEPWLPIHLAAAIVLITISLWGKNGVDVNKNMVIGLGLRR